VSGGLSEIGLRVSVHLYPESGIVPEVLAVGDRIATVVRVEGNGVSVSVFAERAELARLRDAVDRLIAERDSAAGTANGSAA
jgi:hypothetical protein